LENGFSLHRVRMVQRGHKVCFPERMGTCFSYALGAVFTALGSFGIFSSLKKSTLYFLLGAALAIWNGRFNSFLLS
jgi:hypothetical protein